MTTDRATTACSYLVLLPLFFGGLALRLLYLFWAKPSPILWDAAQFSHTAEAINKGVLDQVAWGMLAQRGPFYSLFIAGIYAFSKGSVTPVLIVQADG